MLGDKKDLFAKNWKKAFMRDEPEDCFFFFSSTKPKLFFELLRQNFISPPLFKGKQTTTNISQWFVLEFGLWIYHLMRWWGIKFERWERWEKIRKRRYREDKETFCQTSIDSFLYVTIFILFYRLPGIYNGAKDKYSILIIMVTPFKYPKCTHKPQQMHNAWITSNIMENKAILCM